MSDRQPMLGIQNTQPIGNVEEYQFEPIKGYPMLQWQGKRPFRSTRFYPAQLKELHGPEMEGWRNKIYWGDNLQVMSHLLKEFRGKISLIYIDPPFDSGADYKRKVRLYGKGANNEHSAFEEKQYTDIWSNDGYLQFMYERVVLIRELLSENGSIYLHCDSRRAAYLKLILDEVFGQSNFINDISWIRSLPHGNIAFGFGRNHDSILYYTRASGFWVG